MEHKTLHEHLFSDGPKRILALDGGGLRGALTLGYLNRIEALLRQRYGGDPRFRLCDYFDLIGGTSTGSIIATGLALGYSVAEVRDVYRSLARVVFARERFRLGFFSSKYPQQRLTRALTSYFGDETLGSGALRTGLTVVTKRLDTDSPWFLHNNPRGRYFASGSDEAHIPNRDLPLSLIVRASCAAPHYFEPALIPIGRKEFGAFVDGAVSAYNNPALQLLMVATLGGYGFSWPMGERNLLLVSIGAGACPIQRDPRKVVDQKALPLALQALQSAVDDAGQLTQTMLQWMSGTPTPWQIDSEVGDLGDDQLGPTALLSYLRYDVQLDPQWIKHHLAQELSFEDCRRLRKIDDPSTVEDLDRLGQTAAAAKVHDSHFDQRFDL